jgi:hypothetical protein
MVEDQQTETPEPTSRGRLPILWPTLVILVLYVLSPPLVERILGRYSPVLTIVYAPLGFLWNHVPIVYHFYEWYYGLFTRT